MRRSTVLASLDAPGWIDGYRIIGPQINAAGVHVYPFDAAFPVAVNHFIFSGRRPYPMNHHDYLEVVYLSSGEVVWQAQERFLAQKTGDLFVMGRTVYHRITELTPPKDNKAVVLYLLPQLIVSASAPGDDRQYLTPFLYQNSMFPHIVPAKTGIPAQVLHFLDLISAELPPKSGRARLSIKTYLKVILLLVNHYADYEPPSMDSIFDSAAWSGCGPFLTFWKPFRRERSLLTMGLHFSG